MEFKVNIQKVDISKLKPNPWNYNVVDEDMMAKIKARIEAVGFNDPVDVREMEDGTYQILDGEHRWTICTELGYKEIYINNLGKMDDVQAREETIWKREARGKSDPVNLSALLKEIESLGGRLDNLPFDPGVTEDYKKLEQFDWENLKKESDAFEQTGGTNLIKILATSEQYDIILKAINTIREQAGDDQMSEGRALELISADYMAGAIPDDKPEDKE